MCTHHFNDLPKPEYDTETSLGIVQSLAHIHPSPQPAYEKENVNLFIHMARIILDLTEKLDKHIAETDTGIGK